MLDVVTLEQLPGTRCNRLRGAGILGRQQCTGAGRRMNLTPFLAETRYIDYRDPNLQKCAAELFSGAENDIERVGVAYVFVRDAIQHTFDIGKDIVPVTASEVFRCKTGIRHTKTILLAEFLRSAGIHTGSCY